jgi:hypothetical protein
MKLGELPVGDLKQFLDSKRETLAGLEMDDPGLELDMDSPADYERIRTFGDSR